MINNFLKKITPTGWHQIMIKIYTFGVSVRDGVEYYRILCKNLFCAEKEVKDFKNIPIIINNFNRVTFPKDLVACLKKRGYHNIHIIDNHSSYPPLIEYYKNCDCEVYRLKDNLGFKAFQLSGLYKKFRNQYFVYTDSDILLTEDCPDDILEYFYKLLKSHTFVSKVGCALKIDDLPDCYAHKEKVQSWELKFWQNEVSKNVFQARLDTTFTLYKPNFPVGSSRIGHNLRVAGNYCAIHRPWYIDSQNPDEEELYYLHSAKTSTFWSKQSR